MSKWNGVIMPNFTKSLDVTFIPLLEMTEEQLKILEFESLRPKAKNRIVETALAGGVVGFFDVNILEKAKAKSRYMWPASEKERARFVNNGDTSFRNVVDDAFESDVVETFISHMGIIKRLLLFVGIAVGIEILDEISDLPEWVVAALKQRDLSPDNMAFLVTLILYSLYRGPEAVGLILSELDNRR